MPTTSSGPMPTAPTMPKPTAGNPHPWQWRAAGLVLLASFLYAASDEIHQAFVPSREGRPMDVLIDTGGAALGLAAVWIFSRWRKRW